MNRIPAAGPLVWASIIAVTLLLLVLFQTILWLVLPILFAVIFCYIMAPWVNYGISKGLTRPRAVFIVTAALWIIVVGVGIFAEPRVAADIRGIRNGEAQDYLNGASELVASARQTLTDKFSLFKPVSAPAPPPPAPLGEVTGGTMAMAPAAPATPSEDLKKNVSDWTDKYSTSMIVELLHWVPSLLLVPYLTYFFLLDGPRFKRFLVRAIPNAFFEKALFLFYSVENQLRRYFRGVLTLTAIDGCLLAIGLWCLGLKAPVTLAFIAAVIAWLPYLGSIAGCLICVVVAHHDSPHLTWLPYEVIVLFIVVRLCDDFVFMPLTIGRSLRMHPLVTVLMILLGGAIAGISGMLLVMPVLGVVMVAGQIVGEFLTDDRAVARYRHAQNLRRARARSDL